MLFMRITFIFKRLHHQYPAFLYHLHYAHRRALAEFHPGSHGFNLVWGAFNIEVNLAKTIPV